VAEARAARSPYQRWTDALTVGGFRSGTLVARFVPGFIAESLAPPIAMASSFANPERRAMVERHMRRVNPTWPNAKVRQAVQGAFDSYTRYFIESMRLPGLPARTIAANHRLTGFSNVTDALEAGRGVILALPHLGGWEWAGRWLGDVGYRVTVVVERLEPAELFEWFVDLREQLGMTVVPLGPDVAPAVLRALRANEIVCLLCDRDLQGGGIEVEFFGERTTLPGGPAMLGLRSGAPIVPVGVYFTRQVNGHHSVVRPALSMERHGSLREDVGRITQALAGELEYLIRRAPDQWHMFQPNWPSDPGYKR
jgi:phosphatidylinositol dimannoside acyltransferase